MLKQTTLGITVPLRSPRNAPKERVCAQRLQMETTQHSNEANVSSGFEPQKSKTIFIETALVLVDRERLHCNNIPMLSHSALQYPHPIPP